VFLKKVLLHDNTPNLYVGKGVPANVAAVKTLEALQSDTEILRMVSALHGIPKVEWKDSVKKVLMKKQKATDQLRTSKKSKKLS